MASHRFLRFKEKRDTAAGLQEEDDPSPAPWQQCRSWHQWHHSVRSPSAWWGGFPGEENLDKHNWQVTNYAVIGCVDDYWLSDCEYPWLHCTVCNYKVWIGKSSLPPVTSHSAHKSMRCYLPSCWRCKQKRLEVPLWACKEDMEFILISFLRYICQHFIGLHFCASVKCSSAGVLFCT